MEYPAPPTLPRYFSLPSSQSAQHRWNLIDIKHHTPTLFWIAHFTTRTNIYLIICAHSSDVLMHFKQQEKVQQGKVQQGKHKTINFFRACTRTSIFNSVFHLKLLFLFFSLHLFSHSFMAKLPHILCVKLFWNCQIILK